jgi:phosphohistidine phosphatase
MSCLYIVRHGIAIEHGTPGYDEDERPLTPLGVTRMKEVARGLKTLKLKIDTIVTSPLPRASRTANILAGVLDLESHLETADALRSGTSAESIRDWLATRDEENLMIVGHNPSLEDLISLLAGGSLQLQLRKGGVACLARLPEGSYSLDWLARPRLLRNLR